MVLNTTGPIFLLENQYAMFPCIYMQRPFVNTALLAAALFVQCLFGSCFPLILLLFLLLLSSPTSPVPPQLSFPPHSYDWHYPASASSPLLTLAGNWQGIIITATKMNLVALLQRFQMLHKNPDNKGAPPTPTNKHTCTLRVNELLTLMHFSWAVKHGYTLT